MRRIISVIAVAALMTVMLVAMAAPAFAQGVFGGFPTPAEEPAVCIGEDVSETNQAGRDFLDEPGKGGRFYSDEAARTGIMGGLASTDCGGVPEP